MRFCVAVLLLALCSPCGWSAQTNPPPAKWSVYFSPKGGCTEAVVAALDKAKSTVPVQAYSFTSAPIAKALVEAHRWGVKVQAVLDKSQRTESFSTRPVVVKDGRFLLALSPYFRHNPVMKKLKSCFLSALGLFALTTLSAHGQGTTLFISSSSVDLTTAPYQDHADFTFPTPSVSLANYGLIQVTFNAPSGYAWRFDPAMSSSGLECYEKYGPVDTGNGGTPYSFNFVPGMENTVTTPSVVPLWQSPTGFGFDYTFQFAGPVEFSGVTVTLYHGVSLSDYEAQAPLGQFSQAFLDGQIQGGGPSLTLVPIPEPSVSALAVLGLGIAGYRRFRATT